MKRSRDEEWPSDPIFEEVVAGIGHGCHIAQPFRYASATNAASSDVPTLIKEFASCGSFGTESNHRTVPSSV